MIAKAIVARAIPWIPVGRPLAWCVASFSTTVLQVRCALTMSVTNGTRITSTRPRAKIATRMIFVQFELGDATTS